jgi:hypothetical protein
MSKADHTIGYAVFNPANPVTVSKMRNMNGINGAVVQAVPFRTAVGNYACTIGAEISPREVQVSKWATNAAGDLREVTVDFGAPANGVTPVDIRIWADDGVSGVPALSDDAINVGVVITRLPMAP